MRNRYTMTVKDMAGVLNRITGYIRRNGWNVARVLSRSGRRERAVWRLNWT